MNQPLTESWTAPRTVCPSSVQLAVPSIQGSVRSAPMMNHAAGYNVRSVREAMVRRPQTEITIDATNNIACAPAGISSQGSPVL